MKSGRKIARHEILKAGTRKNRPNYPRPMPSLTDEAQAIWNETVRCMPPQWWADGDIPLLEVYCEAIASFREATEDLRTNGRIIETDRVLKDGSVVPFRTINPALKLMAEAAGIIRIYSIRLGFGPSARHTGAATAKSSRKSHIKDGSTGNLQYRSEPVGLKNKSRLVAAVREGMKAPIDEGDDLLFNAA